MRKIIGLVGEIAAGKGTWKSFLEDELRMQGTSVAHFRFSDILRESLLPWGVIPPTRENLQKFSILMRENFWETILSDAVRARLTHTHTKDGITIVDGVRWLQDETLIREVNGVLVYITTHADLRYERMKMRNENPGDAEKTWDEFLKDEKRDTEICIPEIGSRAHWQFRNEGSLKDVETNVQCFLTFIDFLKARE